MPTLREETDGNVVPTSRGTTVRALLELARRKPSRIYTWVVVPMPQGRYAVTRVNEIAEKAGELGAAILDMALEDVPGLLEHGGSVQASVALDEAEEQALASPGERMPVLDGEEVLGVLNLDPSQLALPALDPWKLGDVTPYEWPYDTMLLSNNYVVLQDYVPLPQLLWILEGSGKGWIYLVVDEGEDFYRVMAVDTALTEALDRWPPRSPDPCVGGLPLPPQVRAMEEGTVPWEVARERVLDTPARCLPITRGGQVIGVLAEPARRVRTVDDWGRAFEGHEAAGEVSAGGPGTEEEGGTTADGEEGAKVTEGAMPAKKTRRRRARTRKRQSGQGKQVHSRRKRPKSQAGNIILEPPPSRFFNVGLFPEEEDTPLPLKLPLALDGGPYRLGVNIGDFWGLGEKPEEKFAIDGIVREHLEELEEGEALILVVAVRPRAVKKNLVQVDKPRQELTLPKWKDGPLVFFSLKFENPGQHALNVDLFFQGHLLQSLRVEFWVVRQAALPVPIGSLAPDRRLTFSRAGTLSKESLAALEKRPSTLTILVDEQGGQLGLWFYDVGGDTLGTQQPNLSDAILQPLLGRMREALQQVENSYPGEIGGDREKLRLGLWRLASIGNEFYRALLPRVFDPAAPGPAGQIAELNLTPGQVIQVAPLSKLPGVPWELLYDRQIERFREDQPHRVTLCPDFETHPPEACPHDNSKVVCPHSFWGYRYIIEQLPNWVAPGEQASVADLPLLVRNGRPLKFVPLVYGWENLKDHLEALRALAKVEDMDLEPPVTTLDGLEFALKDQLHPADILYFYAHGGFDEHEPMLELGLEGSEFPFTAGDLAAWKDEIDLSLRQPLVVFNACQTAAFLPEHHESLPKGFADRGASGVIGTQVKVHELFAAHFIRIFFQRFLSKHTVGQSLFEARRELLFNYVEGGPGGKEYRPDPRGLVYSLFAAADIELAERVIAPE